MLTWDLNTIETLSIDSTSSTTIYSMHPELISLKQLHFVGFGLSERPSFLRIHDWGKTQNTLEKITFSPSVRHDRNGFNGSFPKLKTLEARNVGREIENLVADKLEALTIGYDGSWAPGPSIPNLKKFPSLKFLTLVINSNSHYKIDNSVLEGLKLQELKIIGADLTAIVDSEADFTAKKIVIQRGEFWLGPNIKVSELFVHGRKARLENNLHVEKIISSGGDLFLRCDLPSLRELELKDIPTSSIGGFKILSSANFICQNLRTITIKSIRSDSDNFFTNKLLSASALSPEKIYKLAPNLNAIRFCDKNLKLDHSFRAELKELKTLGVGVISDFCD